MIEIKENYGLQELNTFHLDIHAKYFVVVNNHEEFHALMELDTFKKEHKFILGGGSNILFTGDYNGLIIKNNFSGIEQVGEDKNHFYVKSGAGEVWHQFVLYCISKNYAGVENLSLIPGSVGAGPIQNIGAYGVELKDVFHELSATDLNTGEEKIFDAVSCKFGYRNSIFKNELKNNLIITSVTFRLNKQPVFNTSYGAIEQELQKMQVKEKNIHAISEAVCRIRKSKLPDPALLGNCGSFFKNPEIEQSLFQQLKISFPSMPGYEVPDGRIKIAAGWLIEQCGWKGKKVGHTGSHKDQALVLVNYGGASGKEIVQLSADIQNSVLDKFGINLEAEVNIL